MAVVCNSNTPQATELDAAQRNYIGDLIYRHECGSDPVCLTSWNKGEDFASLGIGHFIWYPAGVTNQRFHESFPSLLHFVQQRRVITMPEWLKTLQGNPWQNRAAFQAAIATPHMIQLRQWLDASRNEQVLFIKVRLDAALPRMVADLTASDARHVAQQYQRMVDAPMGYFALMDYVNFKGEGLRPSEHYQGQGWGLLQVLLAMQGTSHDRDAIVSFVASAKEGLRERVRLSPRHRHEQRWLAGWENRLDDYVQETDNFLSQQ